jgi:hypothetical protein
MYSPLTQHVVNDASSIMRLHIDCNVPIIMNEGPYEGIEKRFPMRRVLWIIPILSVLLCSTLGSTTHAVGQDPLWQRAMEIATANENWVPGFVVHLEEVYSGLGIRQEKIETHSSLDRHHNREVEATFLKILENGRDITESFTEEFGKSVVLEEEEYRIEHPFRSLVQESVRFTKTDRVKKIQGIRCAIYSVSYEAERGTWKGTAWLDESTGIPKRVEVELVTVPLDEKWYTILDLQVMTTFITDGNGAWYAEEAVVDSEIEFVVRETKVYRSRIKETYNFSDYWRYE